MTLRVSTKPGFRHSRSVDDFEVQIDRLLRGWIEEKISGRAVEWPIEVKGSPFRGLAAFGVKHAPVFFGRSRDISPSGGSVEGRGGTRPAVPPPGRRERGRQIILGPRRPCAADYRARRRPDCGSVARSGDAPERGAGRSDHELGERASSTPSRTFPRTSGVVRRPCRKSPEAITHPRRTGAAVCRSGIGGERAGDTCARACQPRPNGSGRVSRAKFAAQLLIVVDQLDELFAPDVTPDQRGVFARLLVALGQTGDVWLLATLRADLYERFLAEPALFALKTSGDGLRSFAARASGTCRDRAQARGSGRARVRDGSGEWRAARRAPTAGSGAARHAAIVAIGLEPAVRSQGGHGRERDADVGAYQSLGGLAGIINHEAERAIAGLDEAEIGRLPRLLRRLAAVGELDGAEASATPASLTIDTVPLNEAVSRIHRRAASSTRSSRLAFS